MSKSKDLETKGPIIYVTPVPTKDGSFMCTIKKNKNPSDNEKTCEIMAMGMMKMALTDPAYVYDLGLEAIEEDGKLLYEEPIVKGNGKHNDTNIVDILDYIKFKNDDGKLN
tara:strand:+ start:179 stop:511 length:333 start_codon:yes stop_codon:yes gene_type:complete